MIVYLFWHWPRDDVPQADYERDLRRFHAALASDRPAGFVRSAAFRVSAVPWGTVREQYADWCTLADSAALDVLNAAAVSGSRQDPHRRIAAKASGGAGGVLRFVAGRADVAGARHSYWLEKLPGHTYREFDDSFSSLIAEGGCALWRRQMVLGPTTEYVLTAKSAVRMPEACRYAALEHRQVWP